MIKLITSWLCAACLIWGPVADAQMVSTQGALSAKGFGAFHKISSGPIVYATWNPADKDASITLSNGNLTTATTATYSLVRSTIGISSGKRYWENTYVSGSNTMIGIATSAAATGNYLGHDLYGWGIYSGDGRIYNNVAAISYSSAFATSTVIGLALDMNAGTLTIYKNNVSQGTAVTGLTGTIYAATGSIGSANTVAANFGATTLTYSPPAGFGAGLY